MIPAVTGQFDPQVVVFGSIQQKQLTVHAKDQTGKNALPAVQIEADPGISLSTDGSGRNGTLSFWARPQSAAPAIDFASLRLGASPGKDSVRELRTIAYDHIPRIDYFRDAQVKFVVTDLRTSGHRIGYIEGAGDKLPQALEQMGYEVMLLKEKDITAATLKSCDAVITGVRAYDVHDWLYGKYEIFMDYVREGGNLIVQYNRNPAAGSAKAKIGPYTFNVTNVRVTDENAAVSFLLPAHPVLNWPNKITDADFSGWVQERGIYFAGQLDSNYQAILSMHDPGEGPQKGSLIVADYGKGKFVYSGLVFFRELPAGIPGAYRLLANIIALNHRPPTQ